MERATDGTGDGIQQWTTESPDDASRFSNPLVSVIIPTYDRNEYLSAAVETVARQTYDPIELIVVDDCSPTPVRETLADSDTSALATVRCLRHKTNRGANAARNTGIEAASGEFLAFLDDDDEWDPEKVARQVSAFQNADDNVGVVYTGTRYVDTQTGDELVVTPTHSGQVTEDILEGKKFGEFSVMMARSDVVETAGLPDERFPSWQDREWYLRLSVHCTFEGIPEPLTTRRMGHGDQITDDYQVKRDVSYPLLLEKHRPLAAEYGWLTERRFVASLSAKLGRAAVRSNHYRDARMFLGRALLNYPFQFDLYGYLLVSLGGKSIHWVARRLVRTVRSVL